MCTCNKDLCVGITGFIIKVNLMESCGRHCPRERYKLSNNQFACLFWCDKEKYRPPRHFPECACITAHFRIILVWCVPQMIYSFPWRLLLWWGPCQAWQVFVRVRRGKNSGKKGEPFPPFSARMLGRGRNVKLIVHSGVHKSIQCCLLHKSLLVKLRLSSEMKFSEGGWISVNNLKSQIHLGH